MPLCHQPPHATEAATFVKARPAAGVVFRNAGLPGAALGSRAVRIGVKDALTSGRTVAIISGRGRRTGVKQ